MKRGRGSRFIRSCAVLAAVSLLVKCGPTPSRKGIVAYDFVESFPLSESRHEVTFIDFGTPSARQHLRSGWSMDEGPAGSTWVWSLGRKSVLEFFLHEARELPVTFTCFPFQFPGSPPQRVSIAVNGVDLQTVRLLEGSKPYHITLPAVALKTGKNQLEFRYAYSRAAIAVRPKSVGQRILSVGWNYLGFVAGNKRPAPGPRPNVEGDRLNIPFGADVDYYLRLPEGGEITFERLILDGPGQLEVLIDREETNELVLGKFQQSASLSTLAASGPGDDIVRLSFRARAARASSSVDGGVTLVRPVLQTARPAPAGPRQAAADPSGEEEHPKRPNIMGIIYESGENAMKNESKSRTAEPDLPFLLIPDITEHPVDDESNLFASINKRLEFLRTKFDTTGGTIGDQANRIREAYKLQFETLQMIVAYRDFLKFGHDSEFFRSSASEAGRSEPSRA